jgi:hypothetical protein
MRTVLPALVLIAAAPFAGANDVPPADAALDFDTHVRPILRAHCGACHMEDRAKGGLSLDTRAAMLAHETAVVPGDGANSLLIQLVSGDDPEMPARGAPLTAAQVAVLERWIDEGAAWSVDVPAVRGRRPDRAPRRPDVPAVEGVEHPIDRVLAAYLVAHDVRPQPVVDDATFLRRVSLDLVGLLPTVEMLDRFARDAGPDRRARVVRALLDDRTAYAEHWLGFWNDLLRNDYAGTGYIDGGRSSITPWLLAALTDNMPYDRFVTELVSPTDASGGFARGITWRGEASASQRRELQYARSVSRVFLGINMKCASCHDSFIDDWKLADAYGLAAIIAEEPLELHRCDTPTGEMARARFIFPELGTIDPDAPPAIRLKEFAGLMVHPENGRVTRTIVNRIWARLMGRGLVEPVDEMTGAAWSEELLDLLASHLVDHGYDLQETLAFITTSRAYQRGSAVAASRGPYVFRGPAPQRMSAEQYVDAVWTLTGAWPEKRVAPGPLHGEAIDASRPVRASVVHADRLMRALGRPAREQIVTTRPNDLTTLQALELTNGATLNDLVERGAARMLERHPEPAALVDHVYRAALARMPREDERATAVAYLEASPGPDGVADLLWVIMMLPRFQLVR